MIPPKARAVTGDAPIANRVDPEAISIKIKENHDVSQLSRQGAELLAQTNRPNIITLDQFTPYIELFKVDQERYKTDDHYKRHLENLYKQYIRELNINLYEVTIIIKSREEPEEIAFLNRLFTRIRSDIPDASRKSFRDNVPSSVTKNANTTRDQVILQASLGDLIGANNTPEMMTHFSKIKMESALIMSKFAKHNVSPEKRAELLGEKADSATDTPSVSTGQVVTYLDDDDD